MERVGGPVRSPCPERGSRLWGDNTAFSQWVSANGLDRGKPWSDIHERSKAMQIAEIVLSSSAQDAQENFAGCPNTTPIHIMA